MRFVRLALLLLPLTLPACGHSDPPAPTLAVTCNDSLILAGATSINVASDPASKAATLSFPDPANPGATATIPVMAGQPCRITPMVNAGGPGGGRSGSNKVYHRHGRQSGGNAPYGATSGGS
jgi:hypothetical protein